MRAEVYLLAGTFVVQGSVARGSDTVVAVGPSVASADGVVVHCAGTIFRYGALASDVRYTHSVAAVVADETVFALKRGDTSTGLADALGRALAGTVMGLVDTSRGGCAGVSVSVAVASADGSVIAGAGLWTSRANAGSVDLAAAVVTPVAVLALGTRVQSSAAA